MHGSRTPAWSREGTVDGGILAETLLDVAAQVEHDERALKESILEAAARGDTTFIERVVRRWMDAPPRDVCSELSRGTSDKGLDGRSRSGCNL